MTTLLRQQSLVLLIALLVTLTGCGTLAERAERGADRVSDFVTGNDDPDSPDQPVDQRESDVDEPDDSTGDDGTDTEDTDDADLDELIEDAEKEIDEGDAEPGIAAPDITLRDLPDATDATIEHIAYVEAFWDDVDDELDFTYEPLDDARLLPRSTIINEETPCSFRRIEEPLDAEIAAFNAYVTFCEEGVTVVWDDLGLEPDLEERFPGAGMAMLISHEWGHVVQLQRQQFEQSSIIAEQQADCYSGAYAAWAEGRGIEPFTNDQALDFAIISTLETRDTVGSSPDDFGAHGNGFDRVRATQEGYDRGVAFCASYDVTPPPITQTGFLSAQDRDNEGNLPYEQAFELLVPAVEDFYESLSEESLAGIVDEPDERVLRELHASIGDVAIGTEYSLRYGAALQEANGDAVGGVGPALQRACLAGAFLNDALENGIGDDGTGTGTAAGSLSPGDLDEAIITLSTSDELLSNPGVVFEMVAALRVGTLEGIDACALA